VLFNDRIDAGRRLAGRLGSYRSGDVVVLGLPRGGVVVASEIANAIAAPLDVIVVRKLGAPFQPEYALGAIGEGGVRVVDEAVLRRAGVGEEEIIRIERRERIELDRRVARLCDGRARVEIAGRTVVLADDGIATGSTVRAACHVARARCASRVVIAVPVAAQSSATTLMSEADEVVALATPDSFFSIGEYYSDFSPVSEDAVVALLDRAANRLPPA
jgi:putative phosphoribosyl transferase